MRRLLIVTAAAALSLTGCSEMDPIDLRRPATTASPTPTAKITACATAIADYSVSNPEANPFLADLPECAGLTQNQLADATSEAFEIILSRITVPTS